MDWLAAILLGGVVGLDATSFPQAMYSRPFVAGAIGGMLLGRPVEGALIGALLEFFAMPVLPFGAAGYPEGGTAAVSSVLAYDYVAAPFDDEMVFLTVTLGLLLSHASGYSVRLLRIRNGHAVGRHGNGDPIEPGAVERAQLSAMALDFLRGALVTAAGTAVVVVALEIAARRDWHLPLPPLAVLLVAVSVMIGGSLTVFGTVRERVLSFGAGAAIAALAVWAL